jgi:hypothetical protein
MIPSHLEKLILAGHAEYKSYSIGGSGVGTIPCSDNAEFIVITGFLWNPFHDRNLTTGIVASSVMTRINHTLRLYNGKKACVFNFRDNVFRANAQDGLPYKLDPPTYMPAYYVSKQDIFIDIWVMTPIKSVNFAAVPLETEELPGPFAYGNQQATLQLTTQVGRVVNTMGNERNPNEIGPNPQRTSNEFFDLVGDAGIDTSRLASPLGIPENGFPMVTFNVVEVGKIPDNFLR